MKHVVFLIGHIIVIGIIIYYTFGFIGIDLFLQQLERYNYDIVYALSWTIGGETILAITKFWFFWLLAHVVVSFIPKNRKQDNINS